MILKIIINIKDYYHYYGDDNDNFIDNYMLNWYCTTNITSTTTTNYNHYNNHIILLNLSGAIVDKFALEFTHTECKLGLGSNYGLCRREKITILSTLQEVGQDSQIIF